MILKKKPTRMNKANDWTTVSVNRATLAILRKLRYETGYGQAELVRLALEEFQRNLQIEEVKP